MHHKSALLDTAQPPRPSFPTHLAVSNWDGCCNKVHNTDEGFQELQRWGNCFHSNPLHQTEPGSSLSSLLRHQGLSAFLNDFLFTPHPPEAHHLHFNVPSTYPVLNLCRNRRIVDLHMHRFNLPCMEKRFLIFLCDYTGEAIFFFVTL